MLYSHQHIDQLEMHNDDGVQRGTVTGSGAYREYPQGMVSLIPRGFMSYCAIGTNEWATIGGTQEPTGQPG